MPKVDLWSFLYLDALAGLVIFPKGSYADGWFGLTKIPNASLIYGNHEASPKQMSRLVAFKSKVGRHLSYANAV